MTLDPKGSGLVVPGRTPDERVQHRLSSLEVPTEQWRAGANAWTALSYNSGWADYDTATYPGGGWKLDSTGRVWLRGLIKNTAYSTATIATLPAGFRPGKAHHFAVPATAAFGYIRVDANGDVVHGGGTTTWIDLSQVTFEASA